MGTSGRRGQRLVQDGATAREQQRRLIEEARAARRGEQIAEPHQPSRSKLDRVEVPFYPDDLLPKMQQLLAILNDLDHRHGPLQPAELVRTAGDQGTPPGRPGAMPPGEPGAVRSVP